MVWQIDLSGKCIVVTGGNRGIGLAISHQVAQAGAHVAILYRQSEDAPEIAKGIAEKYDVRCVAYKCDVTDQKAVQELFRTIYHDVGPVGGVVCNAGVSHHKPALEYTKEDFYKTFEPNVWGVFVAAQAAALLWKEHQYQNGRIVFISSVSGTVANKGIAQAFYNPSKSALTMLAKALSMEWAPMGILVNVVSPGYVDTDMNQSLRDDAKARKEVEDATFVGRLSTPDEQASPTVFFLSDQASYITGSELIVDGGYSAW
ncbi:hypothetical protein CI109_101071 [Kwoniella shandongensis]|uniref:Ketoreductase domain-containing protein n=1 Tax=Kwoniella shandongensis TaxID=1734106 RepID=A0A5M6C4W1_9TREE|nr:uncharacterized protein CI109_001540 [Kwoniella shandongensis]KAA5530134.1 hypothetical protein CI109_001540 [Kwoniella shandongensis]